MRHAERFRRFAKNLFVLFALVLGNRRMFA